MSMASFKGLEQDHRNLVQHCLTMQKEIKYERGDVGTTR